MKLNYIVGLLLASLLIFSCKDDTETNITNNDDYFDAQIYSFSMTASHKKEGDSLSRAEDSLRFIVLGKTKFAIDQEKSLIYNPDSLPYGIKLEKVKLKVTYNTSYGLSSIQIKHPDSTAVYVWNTTDSVSFSSKNHGSLEFITTAPSGATKTYDIKILVHQVDPEIFVWENKGININQVERQKVLLVNGDFYSYTTKSGFVTLYKASKSSLFWSEQTLTGLPANTILNSINHLNGLFLAISSDGKSYTSNDGLHWNEQHNGKNIAAVYGILQGNTSANDVLLVLLNNGGEYSFASTTDLQTLSTEPVSGGILAKELPISEFASTTNAVRNTKSNILVVTSGLSSDSKVLANTLLIKRNTNGIEVTQSAKNSLFAGGGNSSFYYTNNYLYTIAGNQFYYSNTWGERWFNTSYKQAIDKKIPLRKYQSVVVDEDNYIWIFGGETISEGNYLNDVWRGRLNGFE